LEETERRASKDGRDAPSHCRDTGYKTHLVSTRPSSLFLFPRDDLLCDLSPLPRLQQQFNQHRCRRMNLPAQFVARTASLDAHDADGPLSALYMRNDAVSIEIERDCAMASRELELDPPTVESAEGAFRAALAAEIAHHAAHLLPGDADPLRCELATGPRRAANREHLHLRCLLAGCRRTHDRRIGLGQT
jgi:hypothetical protein